MDGWLINQSSSSMSDRKVITVRCDAIKPNGQQCKRRTRKGDKCFQHLAIVDGLRIKKSTIPGAGLGLFAAKDFKKDVKVVDYKGEISDHASGGDYDLELAPDKFVNANKSVYVGSYSNMARAKDKKKNNAKLTAYRGQGRIKSTVPIKAGKEVLTSYGRNYWKRGD